jgi:hypothetical protein
MKERKFKYEWRRTWEERSHDFKCCDNGQDVGRVYLHHGAEKRWLWFMTYEREEASPISDNGMKDTRDEACYAVEAAYDAAVAKD